MSFLGHMVLGYPLNYTNSMSYLNYTNSINHLNTTNSISRLSITNSLNCCNLTNSMSHLNVTNSMSHLNTTNSMSRLSITNSLNCCHLTNSMSHSDVTNAKINSTSELNLTNSINSWNTTNSMSHLHLTKSMTHLNLTNSTHIWRGSHGFWLVIFIPRTQWVIYISPTQWVTWTSRTRRTYGVGHMVWSESSSYHELNQSFTFQWVIWISRKLTNSDSHRAWVTCFFGGEDSVTHLNTTKSMIYSNLTKSSESHELDAHRAWVTWFLGAKAQHAEWEQSHQGALKFWKETYNRPVDQTYKRDL